MLVNGKSTAAKSKANVPAADRFDYDNAVREAKQILAAGERDQWRLSELAHGVETTYDAESLKKFAAAIGKSFCTVARLRSVWRAWHVEIEGPAPESFAVAQALQSHPDRAEIV